MSDSGRYYIKDEKTQRVFCVEPIDSGTRTVWGDVNPSSGKIEGSYGSKSVGAIKSKDSIITEENGFKNIKTLKPGQSPESYIENLLKE